MSVETDRDIRKMEHEFMEKCMSPHWRPIETAPKDGTIIIVMGSYDYAGKEKMTAIAARSMGGGWSRDNVGYGFVVSCHPTHWMPLPDPPTEAITGIIANA